MNAGEHRAIDCLCNARLRIATSGKRFVIDTAAARRRDPEYKLTERQAVYLWKLVHLYRRQMPCDLIATAGFVNEFDRLPSLVCAPGDHRPPVSRVKPMRPRSPSPPPPGAPAPPAPIEQAELFPELKHLTAL